MHIEENLKSFQCELNQINETITERENAMNIHIQSELQELEEYKKNLEIELEGINNDFCTKSNDLQVVISQLENELLITEENTKSKSEIKSLTIECDSSIQAIKNIENSNRMFLELLKEKNPETSNQSIPVVAKRSFDEYSDSSMEGTHCTALQLQKIRKIKADRKMVGKKQI